MKCKHQWHFVRIYYKSPFEKPFTESRCASFICSECGLLKELEVKTEKED